MRFQNRFFLHILLIFFTGILLVLFRMKRVEQDYTYYELDRELEKKIIERKRIKAQKAKLLSANNLMILAKEFNLKRPRDNQVLVIP